MGEHRRGGEWKGGIDKKINGSIKTKTNKNYNQLLKMAQIDGFYWGWQEVQNWGK